MRRAKLPRNKNTQAEILLWSLLFKNKKMLGYPFLRQQPVDNFTADFFCKPLKLIIDMDGISKLGAGAAEKYAYKISRLKELGYHVLQFQDHEILDHLGYVKHTIENWIKSFELKNPGLAKK